MNEKVGAGAANYYVNDRQNPGSYPVVGLKDAGARAGGRGQKGLAVRMGRTLVRPWAGERGGPAGHDLRKSII